MVDMTLFQFKMIVRQLTFIQCDLLAIALSDMHIHLIFSVNSVYRPSERGNCFPRH